MSNKWKVGAKLNYYPTTDEYDSCPYDYEKKTVKVILDLIAMNREDAEKYTKRILGGYDWEIYYIENINE